MEYVYKEDSASNKLTPKIQKKEKEQVEKLGEESKWMWQSPSFSSSQLLFQINHKKWVPCTALIQGSLFFWFLHSQNEGEKNEAKVEDWRERVPSGYVYLSECELMKEKGERGEEEEGVVFGVKESSKKTSCYRFETKSVGECLEWKRQLLLHKTSPQQLHFSHKTFLMARASIDVLHLHFNFIHLFLFVFILLFLF